MLPRRRLLAGASAALTPVLAPRRARAASRLVRIGHNNPAATPFGQGCRAFAAAVAAAPLLGGLRVQVHDNAALGDELAMVRGCMDGTVDMALAASTVASNVVPEVGLLDTPFLFRDAAAARAVLDGPVGAEFAQALAAKGIRVLAWAENGLRHMTANKPVRRPADLAGLKLRVPQSEVELASFRALGAEPAPLAFPALYDALRRGEFDAQENPIGVIEAGRLFEVQSVLSLTAHIYSAAVVMASQDLLDDLDERQRDALAGCARQAARVTRVAAEAAQRDGVARLRAAGMTVAADVDTPAFLAAARPNLAAMGAKYGAARMERLIRAGA